MKFLSLLTFAVLLTGGMVGVNSASAASQGQSVNDAVIAVDGIVAFESSHADAPVALEGFAPPRRGSYFDWGRARNGWGYCYQWTRNGQVLNQGQPVQNYLCERTNPSYFAWGRAKNGFTYCYQWAKGLALNEGQPVPNYYCH